jgi:hypothetical protein
LLPRHGQSLCGWCSATEKENAENKERKGENNTHS